MSSERIKVDDFIPVVSAIKQYLNRPVQFLGLRKGQDFEEFIQRSKTSWKNYDCPREMGKPQFAHKKIVELE